MLAMQSERAFSFGVTISNEKILLSYDLFNWRNSNLKVYK